MRLIDADALADWINEQREEVTKKQVAGTRESIFTKEALVTMQRCISSFGNKIKAQPTAFDLDKVVEQLEKLKEECEDPLQDYDPNYFIEKAIEFVKGGGVDG